MTWKKPIIPRQLSSTTVNSTFNQMKKRELGEKFKADCDEIATIFRSVPFDKVQMRDFESNKDKPSKLKFMLDEAQKVVDESFGPLAEKCKMLRDKVDEVEKNEVEDGSGAKDFLLEMYKAADTLCKSLDQEAADKYLKELAAASQGGRSNLYDQQIKMRLTQIKQGIVKIVKGIKKVAELEFDAGSEPEIVNGALAFGYVGIYALVNDYAALLKKATDPDAEKVLEEFQPILKFHGDKSLFSCMIEHEELERDIAAVVNDDSEEDDVKEHCKTILNAVRALPSKYKE